MRYAPLLLLVLACSSGSSVEPNSDPPVVPPPEEPPPTPGPAASLAFVAGQEQRAEVATELPIAVVVKVTDAAGRAVPGQIVNFVVVSGGGSVFAGTGQTNADGQSRERWTLGTAAGEQVLEARAVDAATGDPIVFSRLTATADPGPARTLVLAETARTIGLGERLDLGALVTKVADQYDNPVTDAKYTVSAPPPFQVTGTVIESAVEFSDDVAVVVGDVSATMRVTVLRDLATLKGATGGYVCVGSSRDQSLPRYESAFVVDSVTYSSPGEGAMWLSEQLRITDQNGTVTAANKERVGFTAQKAGAFFVDAGNSRDSQFATQTNDSPLTYVGGPYCRTQPDYVTFEPFTVTMR